MISGKLIRNRPEELGNDCGGGLKRFFGVGNGCNGNFYYSTTADQVRKPMGIEGGEFFFVFMNSNSNERWGTFEGEYKVGKKFFPWRTRKRVARGGLVHVPEAGLCPRLSTQSGDGFGFFSRGEDG